MVNQFFTQTSFMIALFPLLAFIIIGLFTGSKLPGLSKKLSLVFSGLSLIWSVGLVSEFYSFFKNNPGEFLTTHQFQWMKLSEEFSLQFGIYLDGISVMMLLVITFIHLLVQVYSQSYMKDEPARFFAQLSFFAFAMIGLVASSNLLQMFIFWELVGTASYSLIGFWYHKPSAVAASKKAFLVTRLADAFFLLGIVILGFHTQNFSFEYLNSAKAVQDLSSTISLGLLSVNALSVTTLFIFIGGWGKSAMFPLHIWLPDAMEGPTPVSSIIHSATMVVAGVFLSARMFPLFSQSSFTLEVIHIVGLFTALFAAVIAITQNDIKRILAFSTLSQLGYMMFSIGISKTTQGEINPLGFQASMFHVFTHAFFKCMLFLGAGSIIHVVHSNFVDKMGGLRKHMPITYGSLLIACLAIGGIPPFAGFYSKDEIILAAFQGGHHFSGIIALFVGGLTSFYMFRFFFLIFHGQTRTKLDHPHEDKIMTLPIAILVIPSIIAGFGAFDIFTQELLPPIKDIMVIESHFTWLPYVATMMGVLGLAIAYMMYGRPSIKFNFSNPTSSLYKTVQNKFYLDEVWLYVTRSILFEKICRPTLWFDRQIIDKSFDQFSNSIQQGGRFIRYIQSGQIHLYIIATISGLILLFILKDLPL